MLCLEQGKHDHGIGVTRIVKDVEALGSKWAELRDTVSKMAHETMEGYKEVEKLVKYLETEMLRVEINQDEDNQARWLSMDIEKLDNIDKELNAYYENQVQSKVENAQIIELLALDSEFESFKS
jgi:RNA processing factor Prp31